MAREMIPIFEKEYGELLFPHGFFLYKHRFYRVDFKLQLIWLVALYLGQSGGFCRVTYSVWPLCSVTRRYRFREGMRIENHYKRWKDRIDFREMWKLENQYKVTSQIFVEDIFDRFVGVKDLRDYIRFSKWHEELRSGSTTLWRSEYTWELVQLGEYQAAGSELRANFESWSASPRVDIDKLRLGEGQNGQIEAVRRYDTLLPLFENQNYDQLKILLEERICNTVNECILYFGKRRIERLQKAAENSIDTMV